MNESRRILTTLTPPPNGLERLRARRTSHSAAVPSWWALAGGCSAVIAWVVFGFGYTEIDMPLTGSRLIDERSNGVTLQILEGGHASAVPTTDANVRMYWIAPSAPPRRH